jgi:hypothetical protein
MSLLWLTPYNRTRTDALRETRRFPPPIMLLDIEAGGHGMPCPYKRRVLLFLWGQREREARHAAGRFHAGADPEAVEQVEQRVQVGRSGSGRAGVDHVPQRRQVQVGKMRRVRQE